MNWEETIRHIRKIDEYQELVKLAYFDENLVLNIERYRASDEYLEVKELIKNIFKKPIYILDVGSGNGITAVNFALDGHRVIALEPDLSKTVGAGAIQHLKEHFNLNELNIVSCFTEEMDFPNETFDLVFVRQAMHHAHELNTFIKQCERVLKKGGYILTIRDHVIYSNDDKEIFFKAHPLHKFYGGENAFTATEYQNAFKSAGLNIIHEWKYYDTPINYFPLLKKDYNELPLLAEQEILERLKKKISIFANLPFIKQAYLKRCKFDRNKYWDETRVPGRMYSYLAQKK